MLPELRATTLLPLFGFFIGFLGDWDNKFLHDGAVAFKKSLEFSGRGWGIFNSPSVFSHLNNEVAC